jgi:hypothetical protein
MSELDCGLLLPPQPSKRSSSRDAFAKRRPFGFRFGAIDVLSPTRRFQQAAGGHCMFRAAAGRCENSFGVNR